MTTRTLRQTLLPLLLLSLLALPLPAPAQSPGVQFAAVPVADALVISLPQDWLVWRRADHTSDDEADQSAVDLILGVNPGAELERPFTAPWDKLMALPPAPVENGFVRLTVESESLDALSGRTGLIVQNISPERLLQLAGADYVLTVDVNGRYSAIGRLSAGPQPAIVSTYVFDALNQAVIVSLLAPPDWLAANEQLVAALLSGLRVTGEPVDTYAFGQITNAPWPTTFSLPPDSVAVETVIPAGQGPTIDVCGGMPSQIVFSSDRDGDWELYRVNTDGTDLRRLTESAGPDIASSWSPDGSRLYFHSSRNGNSDIFSMNADGGDVQQITTTPQDELAAGVSPDGTRIAFHRFEEEGQSDIYVLDLAGGEEQRLTTNSGMEQWPAWSPDGSLIAFNADFAGSLDLYVMNADGSKVRRLTRDAAPDGPPLWSPDGAHILFWSEREHGLSEAYLMNADGRDTRQLTYNEATDFAASWSPDGRFIALESSRDGNTDIYMLGLNSHEFRRLTDHPADDIDPRWRPCAAD